MFFNWLGDRMFHMFLSLLKSSNRMPRHIALIPDNNRTYSRKQKISLMETYTKAIFILKEWLTCLKNYDVQYVTIFLVGGFNMKRAPEEVAPFIKAIEVFVMMLTDDPQGCRFLLSGRQDGFPKYFQKLCNNLTEKTKDNTGLTVNLALNHVSRWEQTDAVIKCVQDYREGSVKLEDITEEYLLKYFPTDVRADLYIRSSTHVRFSEFWTWQSAYNGLLVCFDKCWPEITKWELMKALFYYSYFDSKVRRVAE